jgi:acyl-[acyl carrier protein]--UDP-N-acetylglucosamine O-acyltransferase
MLFRKRLSIPNALARIESDLPAFPEIEHLVQFVRASGRGISKGSVKIDTALSAL